MAGLTIDPVTGGVRISLVVRPGARKNAVLGTHDGALRVAVNQAPERGKANDSVVRVLADWLAVSRAAVEIESGHTAPRKRVLLHGVEPGRLLALVDALADE